MTETSSVCRRLVGRTAVVTGAGSGIGLATVRRLAAEGAHVVCADVDEVSGKAAAEEAGAGSSFRTDVTDAEQVDALFKAALSTYGSVDIAFNNAGISPPDDDSILETGLDAWRRVQEVNLTSVFLCCKAAIPYMRTQGRGSIINTASFVARMGAATSQISYTASKGGVLAMSRELGVRVGARDGIRVNALCPGQVNTAAPGAVRQGPGAGGAASCAHPGGPVRRADRDRRHRGVPGERRLLVRQRDGLPGGRRDRRGVRHPGLGTPHAQGVRYSAPCAGPL
ncbi:3-phenylpropionate-dihydrodiol/cinnamic acid-dihydrodiol dehydrogenase [Streptomyces violarus]